MTINTNISELAARRRQDEIRRSTDILAKLLANENLTVISGGVTTSMIDLNKRVVYIVEFKPTSPLSCREVRITCIGHEVGHALFTPKNLMHGASEKKFPGLFMFINVVEDIRIERLMKNKFKGLHSIMKEGRKVMYENGFYGQEAIDDPNSMNYLNKVILYTKVGAKTTGLTLSVKDESVIKYIERNAVDEPSVIHCAKFLYQYCKMLNEDDFDPNDFDTMGMSAPMSQPQSGSDEQKKQQQPQKPEENNDGDKEEGDSDSGGDDNDESDGENDSGEPSDKSSKNGEDGDDGKNDEDDDSITGGKKSEEKSDDSDSDGDKGSSGESNPESVDDGEQGNEGDSDTSKENGDADTDDESSEAPQEDNDDGGNSSSQSKVYSEQDRKKLNNFLQELEERSNNMTSIPEDDVKKYANNIEENLNEKMKGHVEKDVYTSTIRKDTFSKQVIKKYVPKTSLKRLL